MPTEFLKQKTMAEEKVLLNATLCFPKKGDKILLGFKTQKIGKDCWNGYGGGIEPGENSLQSIIRELEEELGIKASSEALEKMAVIDFHNIKTDGSKFVCRVHVYFLNGWQGEFKESDEMINPTWFNQSSLPMNQMMLADKVWLPLIMAGQKIIAECCYGPFQKELLTDVDVQVVKTLPND